jgi:hypothetical protein
MIYIILRDTIKFSIESKGNINNIYNFAEQLRIDLR